MATRTATRSRLPEARTTVQVPHFSLSYILRVVALFVISVIVLAPIIWTFSTSLRIPANSFSLPPAWIPTDLYWPNYAAVFQTIPFDLYVLNTAIVTGCIVVGQIITASLAGYAFGRLTFPAKNVLFWLIMATMMIPLQATIIPVFVLISKMGLANTLAALILPAIPTAFGTFLLRQYFRAIPEDFAEAALIDGASQWQIFARVYLPLAKPGLAVLAILSFNAFWNDFFRPLIFLSSQEKYTIPLGLVNLQGYMGTGSISIVLAGVMLSLVPVLIIFFVGQKYLIEGIMMGGVKG